MESINGMRASWVGVGREGAVLLMLNVDFLDLLVIMRQFTLAA